jgi:DNA-binding FadR family transcriptional regulator
MSADPDVPLASDALLRPVRPGNPFEDTVERLLQTIRLGVLQPGESLPPERELAARLGVSRDTVREAIKSLADAGYLVSRRGRYGGTFLADELPRHTDDSAGVTRAEIDDALRLREILEVGAARMAANRTLTASEREVLWSRLADVRGAAPDDYRRLDSRLHLAIAEAAGSQSLVPLVAGCDSTGCSTRFPCCRAISPIPTSSTKRSSWRFWRATANGPRKPCGHTSLDRPPFCTASWISASRRKVQI